MSQILVDKGTSTTIDPILRVEKLNVVFSTRVGLISVHNQRPLSRNIQAVNNLSFDLSSSGTLTFVGESGSGKTTIARCIVGLLSPTSGSIKYRGAEVISLTGKALKEYRRHVQIVFQDPYESLNPRDNVFTTLSLPLRHLVGENNTRILNERITDLMREVGLDLDLIHRYPHQLSGGERQRVSIARALASDPEILIADEPISMLDAAQRADILRLLVKLRKERKLSIILITHDVGTAKIMGGRTLVMYRGRAFEYGDVESVLRKPCHPYIEVMLEAMPSLSKKPQLTHAEKVDLRTAVEAGCIFRPHCKYALPVCVETEPQLEQKREGHLAACHNPLH
jgi:oligopeptide/dipeptide ABC transporter ATP-binding protein